MCTISMKIFSYTNIYRVNVTYDTLNLKITFKYNTIILLTSKYLVITTFVHCNPLIAKNIII